MYRVYTHGTNMDKSAPIGAHSFAYIYMNVAGIIYRQIHGLQLGCEAHAVLSRGQFQSARLRTGPHEDFTGVEAGRSRPLRRVAMLDLQITP